MNATTPGAETSYGKLQGAVEGGVSVFRGIPFARPPVGSLRFRRPERAERWTGVRDATRFGPGSYQASRPLAPILGIVIPEQSEDCLTLNKLAELHASHTPDVFVYEFAWKAVTPGKPQGAVHALELPFVFGTLDVSEIGAITGRTPAARVLSERMQDAWLAFARTGRPESAGLPAWPPYAPPRRATLELGEQPALLEAPRESERRWWEAFLPR